MDGERRAGALLCMLGLGLATPCRGQTAVPLGNLVHFEQSAAYAINNSGLIVGSASRSKAGVTEERAVCWEWTPGGYLVRELERPSGLDNAAAFGLNDAGDVVGWGYSVDDTGNATYHAVLWERAATGSFTPVDLNAAVGSADGYAQGINDVGRVVGGTTWVSPTPGRALLWQRDKAGKFGETDLGTPEGFTNAAAFSVNSSSLVVGRGALDVEPYASAGFVWRRSEGRWVPHRLSRVPGFKWTSIALDLNAGGEIAGHACRLDPELGQRCHAVLWKRRGQRYRTRDLGTLPGWSDSWAFAINSDGMIVGVAAGSSSGQRLDSAVFWTPSGPDEWSVRALQTSPGYRLGVAYDVSDAGQIVGSERSVVGAIERAVIWEAASGR